MQLYDVLSGRVGKSPSQSSYQSLAENEIVNGTPNEWLFFNPLYCNMSDLPLAPKTFTR